VSRGKIAHTLHHLIRQRVFAIACGYADCNDAARLMDDPIQKLLAERDLVAGETLAPQPTLPRFENAVGPAVRDGRSAGSRGANDFYFYDLQLYSMACKTAFTRGDRKKGRLERRLVFCCDWLAPT
jgi:DDE family transposase